MEHDVQGKHDATFSLISTFSSRTLPHPTEEKKSVRSLTSLLIVATVDGCLPITKLKRAAPGPVPPAYITPFLSYSIGPEARERRSGQKSSHRIKNSRTFCEKIKFKKRINWEGGAIVKKAVMQMKAWPCDVGPWGDISHWSCQNLIDPLPRRGISH